MLGRLEMDVDSCIEAYTNLMSQVFEMKKSPIDLRLNVQGRFDTAKLENAIKSLITSPDDPALALLNDEASDRRPCRM